MFKNIFKVFLLLIFGNWRKGFGIVWKKIFGIIWRGGGDGNLMLLHLRSRCFLLVFFSFWFNIETWIFLQRDWNFPFPFSYLGIPFLLNHPGVPTHPRSISSESVVLRNQHCLLNNYPSPLDLEILTCPSTWGRESSPRGWPTVPKSLDELV